MKRKKIAAVVILILTTILTACTKEPTDTDTVVEEPVGQIYLYGEIHGNQLIFEKELELWKSYYDNQGMRHLFVEFPYYTAEFLNLWMEAENDTILNQLYQDWEGTAIHTEDSLNFYKELKKQCPETIFHGTDVGHQYYSTGERYLAYLESNGMAESEQYTLTEECIEQGKRYYTVSDNVYRENALASNFIREFDALTGEDIMGIYGAAHTDINASDYNTGTVPCMANQLNKIYSKNLYTEDLSPLALDIEPLSYDTFTINGKDYAAAYYGKQDLSVILPQYQYREYWLLENAYEDFKASQKTGDVLPYNNYIMTVEVGQVYLIKYTLTDGSVQTKVYRADGNTWQNIDITEEIVLE